ncbi:uncharacterized protein LOC130895794 [Diorhabda carinulata]|uniref:uncharacterized protein LOC130895794 n=1 Tax=Diorhabda carinulata TaxID=1163345 RepID=UPI0025A06C5E|nr:uncharacterized protein LOC130895794 [Diorhabda carinulata]
MLKLVVLSAFVAFVATKPSGLLVQNPVVQTYGAPLVAGIPSAVSHSYRSDLISHPLVASHAIVETPVVENVVATAVPSAVSHTYRKDVINKPVVAAVSTPVVENVAAKIATPIVDVVPSAVSHTYRKDVINEPVVAAVSTPVVENVAAKVATPIVDVVPSEVSIAKVAAPVVSDVVAPSAVSHSFRSDFINNQVVADYYTPTVVAKHIAAPSLYYSGNFPNVYVW